MSDNTVRGIYRPEAGLSGKYAYSPPEHYNMEMDTEDEMGGSYTYVTSILIRNDTNEASHHSPISASSNLTYCTNSGILKHDTQHSSRGFWSKRSSLVNRFCYCIIVIVFCYCIIVMRFCYWLCVCMCACVVAIYLFRRFRILGRLKPQFSFRLFWQFWITRFSFSRPESNCEL